MEQLIEITEINGSQAVNARDLHKFLVTDSTQNEVGEKFSDWIKRYIEYGGFEKELDYQIIEYNYQGEEIRKSDNQRVSKRDFVLSMDCAKQISMLQRNDKGKQARLYFIACEKKLKSNLQLPQSLPEALRLAANLAEQKEKAVYQLNQAKKTIETNRSKVVFAESVTGSNNSILIRQFAKDLCDDSFKIGQNRLFEWFRKNKYLNRNNEPYQNFIEQGLFEVITRSIGSGEETFTSKTTKITGKGAVYFAQKIKGQHQLISA